MMLSRRILRESLFNGTPCIKRTPAWVPMISAKYRLTVFYIPCLVVSFRGPIKLDTPRLVSFTRFRRTSPHFYMRRPEEPRVPDVVVWPCLTVDASYRVNLIVRFPLKQNCPRKIAMSKSSRVLLRLSITCRL